MGKAIAAEPPDLILCSPAKRTRETLAEILPALPNKPRAVYVDALYSAPGDYAEIIADNGDDAERLLVVGHNPTIHLHRPAVRRHRQVEARREMAASSRRRRSPTIAFEARTGGNPGRKRETALVPETARPRRQATPKTSVAGRFSLHGEGNGAPGVQLTTITDETRLGSRQSRRTRHRHHHAVGAPRRHRACPAPARRCSSPPSFTTSSTADGCRCSRRTPAGACRARCLQPAARRRRAAIRVRAPRHPPGRRAPVAGTRRARSASFA